MRWMGHVAFTAGKINACGVAYVAIHERKISLRPWHASRDNMKGIFKN
jgi:hypothetical protein